jgi:lysophospholipase L1-like esterase
MTAKQLAADTAPLLDPASDGAKLVSDAEIATVDIGANDLLGTLYAYVKSLQSPADADPAKVVRLLDQAVLDLYGPGGKQTQADIAAVLKNILAANGGVKLYVMGYYNPLPLISAFYGVDLKEPVKYLNGLIQEAISDASDAYPNAFITYVPTFEAMASSPDSLVVYDIHPTESGYETIANEFWKEITLLESYYISNAVPSVSPIVMGGSELPFTAYNINGNNYVKLRDVAMALSGSPKQFGVSYDDGAKSVGIRTGAAYVPYGGELCGTADKAACTAALSTCEFTINGVRARLTAYNVNGNNYVKLRDVGEALDFGVEYDHNTNTVTIDASKCYSPEA